MQITKAEREAVLPQLACRMDALNQLMCEAGERKDARRVQELMEFISNISSFYEKLLFTKTVG